MARNDRLVAVEQLGHLVQGEPHGLALDTHLQARPAIFRLITAKNAGNARPVGIEGGVLPRKGGQVNRKERRERKAGRDRGLGAAG